MRRRDTPRCPRCGEPVELDADGSIKAHRDALTVLPCPVEGLAPAQAAEWLEQIRGGMRARARASMAARRAGDDATG